MKHQFPSKISVLEILDGGFLKLQLENFSTLINLRRLIMLKKMLTFVIIFLFVLFQLTANYGYCESKNTKFINKIYNETGFKLDDMFKLNSIKEIRPFIISWNHIDHGCADIPAEKKSLIRNTKAVAIGIDLFSGLTIGIRMANFKNKDDANLGFLNNVGYLPGTIEALISKKPIANDFLLGSREHVGDSTANFYILVENCVCTMDFTKREKFTNEEIEFMDRFIILVKNVIEKSVK